MIPFILFGLVAGIALTILALLAWDAWLIGPPRTLQFDPTMRVLRAQRVDRGPAKRRQRIPVVIARKP